MFVQHFIKLSAAVHELSCSQKKKQKKDSAHKCRKQYCRHFVGSNNCYARKCMTCADYITAGWAGPRKKKLVGIVVL